MRLLPLAQDLLSLIAVTAFVLVAGAYLDWIAP